MRIVHSRVSSSEESGISLIETVIVLFVLATIAVTFLTGMAISAQAVFTADEHATAAGLAHSQMEWAQNASYTANATSYSAAPIPDNEDYSGYSANITAEPLNSPDDGIQRITVTVSRSGSQVFTLESYKVNR